MNKLIRRTHLYLAMFLMPWMVIYALSTIAMNHRHTLNTLYDTPEPGFAPAGEQSLTVSFSVGVSSQDAATLVLQELGMEGLHSVQGSLENDRLVIYREAAMGTTRITFTPSTQTAVLEVQEFRLPYWLEEMHRRRGYNHGTTVDWLWALSVDLVIISMILWACTGLWMWWDVKATRRWGAVCLAGGAAVFIFFLLIA